jgi:hypothetical protein
LFFGGNTWQQDAVCNLRLDAGSGRELSNAKGALLLLGDSEDTLR